MSNADERKKKLLAMGFFDNYDDEVSTVVPPPVAQLPNPSGLSIEGNVLSWDTVPNAMGYSIYVEEVVLDSVGSEVLTLSLSSIVGIGDYTIGIVALGDDIKYSDSEASEIVYTVIVDFNPSNGTETASIIFASGSSGNHAFIDRYAVAKVEPTSNTASITGNVVLTKVMNSTNSGNSTGSWRFELIEAQDADSFDNYKTIYTSAYDTQTDLTSDNKQGNIDVHRTPTNNTDTWDVDLQLTVEPNKIYYLVITYGCTGLGYYANNVISNCSLLITSEV